MRFTNQTWHRGDVYYHPGHLGGFRGEPYAQSGTADLSFTGQRQDTVAGLYDFPAREYSIQGRWPSPDPAGLAAVDPSNPQSWNRYAYVYNNPLALLDPTGLDPQFFCIPGYSVVFSDTNGNTGSSNFSGECWTYDTGYSYPPLVGPNINLSSTILNLKPSVGNSSPAIPTAAEAATKFCEEHGQVASTIRGTNVPIAASLSATAGPVNYNTKNEITPVIPAFPWPEWLSFGAGVDVSINVPEGSAPSWSVGLGKNLGISFYPNAQGKVTGVNLNIGLSIGPPVTVSPGSANACGLRTGG